MNFVDETSLAAGATLTRISTRQKNDAAPVYGQRGGNKPWEALHDRTGNDRTPKKLTSSLFKPEVPVQVCHVVFAFEVALVVSMFAHTSGNFLKFSFCDFGILVKSHSVLL